MREKILFDDNWLFHLGDIKNELPQSKGPVYMQAKTERAKMGPACKDYRAVADEYGSDAEYKSERWDRVTLLHDYIIAQNPKENENCGLGFFEYQNAWYRKEFDLPLEDETKRITLLFEGVAVNSEIYLNGCLLKRNFSGYNTFEVDITDVAVFGGKNVLAVYVTAHNHEGWWYEGAGIYRHVWLIKTEKVYTDLWGVYVKYKKEDGNKWHTEIETTVVNKLDKNCCVKVKSTIYDSCGNEVASCGTEGETICGEKTLFKYSFNFSNPLIWDIDNPNLYSVSTSIFADGEECDCTQTRYGYREFYIDSDKGFFLNGKHVKIKGVCAHQDCGFLGKAVSDNIHRYKIELIKEMGANGYRTSHYAHSEATMDALDELGFIVMNETRWFESTEDGISQLEMLIKRDRNRPSVFFWSLGNEEPLHTTNRGVRIFKSMASAVKKLDDTRIIITAVSHTPTEATVFEYEDIIGINYNLLEFEKIRKKYPQKTILSTECCATGTTRGWYFDDCPVRGYLSAYDKETNSWFKGREDTWKALCKHDWILGGYQWIAFDHRGEAVWPRICSQSGAIDLFLQKKDAFYQNQSHWIEDRPIVHIMPHWNFAGMEGEKINVRAYTNCDELELIVNGKSFGKKQIEKYGHADWNVEYVPGKIEVLAYNKGKLVASDFRETSGKSEKLVLRLDNALKTANGRDIAIVTCYCVDKNGRVVYDAAPYIHFDTNELGCIVGTGSDISDHTSVTLPDRKMRAGIASAAVKVGHKAGMLKVYARSEGLISAVLSIKLD